MIESHRDLPFWFIMPLPMCVLVLKKQLSFNYATPYAKIYFMANWTAVSFGVSTYQSMWSLKPTTKQKIQTVVMHLFIPLCSNRKYKTVIGVDCTKQRRRFDGVFLLILAYLNGFFIYHWLHTNELFFYNTLKPAKISSSSYLFFRRLHVEWDVSETVNLFTAHCQAPSYIFSSMNICVFLIDTPSCRW